MFENQYNSWGFTDNPFQPNPLNSDEWGDKLLVGRGAEQNKIYNRLILNSGIVTIEGENGIGKTSLVNVVAYVMHRESLKTDKEELYIPCSQHFQLTKDLNLKDFVDQIYYTIAQTLIERSKIIEKTRGNLPNKNYIDAWLNSSEINSISAQIMAFGAGEARELNTGGGFLNMGFKVQIKSWLSKIFPKEDNGGIICLLDNLELLQETEYAKSTLDYLRDDLFSIPGTKWVFCGSHGIITTLASSTRMADYLHKPISLAGVKSTFISSILESRIEVFNSNDNHEPYLPIVKSDFKILYDELNGNLRTTLKKADQYCLWVHESGIKPEFPTEKSKAFSKWLANEKQDLYDIIKHHLNPDSLDLFKEIIGSAGRLDVTQYCINKKLTVEELEPLIINLDSLGLISLTLYEREDFKRSFGTFLAEIPLKSSESIPDLIETKEISGSTVLTDTQRKESEDVSDFYERDVDLSNDNNSSYSSVIKEIVVTPKGWLISDLV